MCTAMAQRSRRKCSTECRWKIWYIRYVEYLGIMVKAFKATLSNWQKHTAVRFLSQSRKKADDRAERPPAEAPCRGNYTLSYDPTYKDTYITGRLIRDQATTKQLSKIAAKRLRICKFATGQDAFKRESLDEHCSERKISENWKADLKLHDGALKLLAICQLHYTLR